MLQYEKSMVTSNRALVAAWAKTPLPQKLAVLVTSIAEEHPDPARSTKIVIVAASIMAMQLDHDQRADVANFMRAEATALCSRLN